jgi:hypothetical protein
MSKRFCGAALAVIAITIGLTGVAHAQADQQYETNRCNSMTVVHANDEARPLGVSNVSKPAMIDGKCTGYGKYRDGEEAVVTFSLSPIGDGAGAHPRVTNVYQANDCQFSGEDGSIATFEHCKVTAHNGFTIELNNITVRIGAGRPLDPEGHYLAATYDGHPVLIVVVGPCHREVIDQNKNLIVAWNPVWDRHAFPDRWRVCNYNPLDAALSQIGR